MKLDEHNADWHRWTLMGALRFNPAIGELIDLDTIEEAINDLIVQVKAEAAARVGVAGEPCIVVKAGRVLRATKEHATMKDALAAARLLSEQQPGDTFLIFQRVGVIEPKGADTEGGA